MKNKIKLPKGWELEKLEDGVYEVIQESNKLENGKDYVHAYLDLLVINRIGHEGNSGFTHNGERFDSKIICSYTKEWREATNEEVVSFFEKHLIERYGEDWRNVKIKECMYFGGYEYHNTECYNSVISKYERRWQVWNNNGCLFNGKEWAEVLEEPKYAEKLEDIDRPYYIESSGKIRAYYQQGDNQFTTKERAEQILALIQLIAFRDDIWANGGYGNCGIKTSFSGLMPHEENHGMFSFKDKETCEYFIEKHRDLLEVYSGIFKK